MENKMKYIVGLFVCIAVFGCQKIDSDPSPEPSHEPTCEEECRDIETPQYPYDKCVAECKAT